MTGQAHWFGFVPILLGGIALLWLLWRDRVAERSFHVEERRFLCPALRTKVIAKLVRDAESGRVIGVRSCTAFTNPETVTCDKECVPGFKRSPAPQEPAGRGAIS